MGRLGSNLDLPLWLRCLLTLALAVQAAACTELSAMDPQLPRRELPDATPTRPPADERAWDRTISDTTVYGNLVVPAGEEWLIGPGVRVAGNVLVQDATLGMRPGSSLEFLGADPSAYVGGGMRYTPAFDRDIGLWVWGSGRLDVACTPKTGWNRSGVDPSWQADDEYWVAPTGVGEFAPRRWSPGEPIPQRDPRLPAAEVVNVTRDCTITGPGHIHIHSTQPQRIEYVRLQSMGVAHPKFFKSPHDDPALTGRYALHLHMSGAGTKGTVIRGVAAVESRGKVFVPHASHGVTFVDNVSVNSWSSAFWWDEGEATNDVLVDRMAVLGVELPFEVMDREWSNKAGIILGEGVDMEIRNSVVAGVRGWDSYAGGFDWINPVSESPRTWIFRQGNVSHNNQGSGLRFWTNLTDAHHTSNFIAYGNRTNGIESGAYQNGLQWEDGILIGNGIFHNNSSKANERNERPFYRNVRVEAQDGPALIIGHRIAATHPGMGVQFIDCVLTAGPGHPKVLIQAGDNPWFGEFIRSGVTPDDIVFATLEGGNEGSRIRIEHEDGRRWEIRVVDGVKVVSER